MDYDIIVVGGGPAGLSAAVRAAWLGAPSAEYKASILVLECSDGPGGLSRWQPLVTNSPGNFFTKRELNNLIDTCEAYGVEIRLERVVALSPGGQNAGFDVETTAGRYRSLAVIVATGCRQSYPGESQLFHRNRILWFSSSEELRHLIAQLDTNEDIHTVCLCGACGVGATRRLIGVTETLEILTYAEPPYPQEPLPEAVKGRLVNLSVDARRQSLSLGFRLPDGRLDKLTAEVLLLDFNSYEANATSTQFLDKRIPRLPDAFLAPDRSMATEIPGLFSAGDVNGGPFSVAKAISEGTIAGFSAYDYVCTRRTGTRPNLFPFFPYKV